MCRESMNRVSLLVEDRKSTRRAVPSNDGTVRKGTDIPEGLKLAGALAFPTELTDETTGTIEDADFPGRAIRDCDRAICESSRRYNLRKLVVAVALLEPNLKRRLIADSDRRGAARTRRRVLHDRDTATVPNT